MMRMETKTQRMAVVAMIAALYTALTLALGSFGFGAVQFRVAEALTLLPILTPLGTWGITLGCALSNLAGAAMGTNILGWLDVIFGTLATFLAALLTRRLGRIRFKGVPVLASLPPVVCNAVVVGAELAFATGESFRWSVFALSAASVAAGQFVACCLLGLPMLYTLERSGLDKMLFGVQTFEK